MTYQCITLKPEGHQKIESIEDGISKRGEENILQTRNANVFIYPNQHGGNVFVQTADDEKMLRTGFELPAWIVGKALQILQRTTNHGVDSSHTLEADTLRRKQEEKISKISDDIKVFKNEIESVKHDIKSVLSILRKDN